MGNDSRIQPPKEKGKRTQKMGQAPKGSLNHPDTLVTGGQRKTEHPPIIKRQGDKHIASPNHNAHILLGGDVGKDGIKSGYGAVEDHAGEVRLVVGIGRGERDAAPSRTIAGIETHTHLNPKTDAAFIKVSEKCNIDHELELVNTTSVPATPRRSAIGMSADAIRICADEGIKLVTKRKRRNSKGVLNSSTFGVDIIAGNDKRGLEPMLKGKRTAKALRDLEDEISNINGIIFGILQAQMQYNMALMTHVHFSPFFAIPTTSSLASFFGGLHALVANFQSIIDLVFNKINLEIWKFETCYPFGAGYICSRHNHVN